MADNQNKHQTFFPNSKILLKKAICKCSSANALRQTTNASATDAGLLYE